MSQVSHFEKYVSFFTRFANKYNINFQKNTILTRVVISPFHLLHLYCPRLSAQHELVLDLGSHSSPANIKQLGIHPRIPRAKSTLPHLPCFTMF